MIKIDQADKVFSQYIRLRDKRCLKCNSPVKLNDQGLPISHQCSHFHGRGHEGTRYEPDNCDTLCYGCHQYFGANPLVFTEWKRKQLGEKRFKSLLLQANAYCKKDRKLALIKAKALLSSVK